jgi:hypothetical protein
MLCGCNQSRSIQVDIFTSTKVFIIRHAEIKTARIAVELLGPFAAEIFSKVARAKQALESQH